MDLTAETIGIRVPKQKGEKALGLLHAMGVIDPDLQVQKNDRFIFIPLLKKPSKEKLQGFREEIEGQIVSRLFHRRKKQSVSLFELLRYSLPPDLLEFTPHSMDLIGDIAIIELLPQLDPYKKIIGQAILNSNDHVRTVLKKASAVEGTFRLRKLEVIAGSRKVETIHKENGCKFSVDPRRAYFSPRLSFEHSRVAHLVNEGEIVVDLFAGIGPFSVQIAKSQPSCTVRAIDINPAAIGYLKKNIRLNRVDKQVVAFCGKAEDLVKERFSYVADRTIMNLPEQSLRFVHTACRSVKATGGIIHYYSFLKGSESMMDSVKTAFGNEVAAAGREVEEILFSRKVRETAPFEWQVVLDAKIR